MADALRRRAALKVLGLTEADLEPDDSSAFVQGLFDVNKDLEQMREKVHEEKRKLLRAEVEKTAMTLADEDVEQILAISKAGRNVSQVFGHNTSVGPGSSNGQVALMTDYSADLMNVEMRKIAEYREKKKAELQKNLEDEMDKKKQAVERFQKAEAEKKRLAEINNAKKANTAAGAKEREKKHAQLQAALNRANEARAERLNDFEKKLNANQERVDQQLARNASELANRNSDKHEKSTMALQRKKDWEMGIFNDACKRMDDRAEKELGVERMLLKLAEDSQRKADENRMKFLQKMMDTAQRRQQQEQADHSSFLESEDRKAKVREQHTQQLKDYSGRLHQSLEKGMATAKRRMGEIKREREDKRRELEKSIADEAEATAQNANARQMKLREESQRRMASRQIITDIVKENQKRLKKANEYSSYQTLAKVCSNIGRVDELLDRRKQVVSARVNAQREAMIERARMEQAFQKVSGNSTQSKVNSVLKGLGMTLSTAEGKDGEEPQSPKEGDKKR